MLLQQAYDDVVVFLFFTILYKDACIPYDFCCFCGIDVDERFVVDNVIAVGCYVGKKTVFGSPLSSSLNAKAPAFCINWLNYHKIRCEVKK